MQLFEMDGTLYMAVANEYDWGSYTINSAILRRCGDSEDNCLHNPESWELGESWEGHRPDGTAAVATDAPPAPLVWVCGCLRATCRCAGRGRRDRARALGVI